MNSKILSFLVVVAVAAVTADAMIFGIPMSGVWRNSRRGPPITFNFMPQAEQSTLNAVSGIKFVTAVVAPAVPANSPAARNAPIVGSIAGLSAGNSVVFGGLGPNGFAFQY